MSKLRTDLRIAALGAFAGLFTISFFLLVDRVDMHYNYRACVETESYLTCAHSVQNLWWLPLVFWHVLLFVVSAFVVHRYFADFSDSPFLLVQLVGIGAFCGWALSVASFCTLDALTRASDFNIWILLHRSNQLFAAKFFASVFAANTACASLLHSAARLYAPNSPPPAA